MGESIQQVLQMAVVKHITLKYTQIRLCINEHTKKKLREKRGGGSHNKKSAVKTKDHG